MAKCKALTGLAVKGLKRQCVPGWSKHKRNFRGTGVRTPHFLDDYKSPLNLQSTEISATVREDTNIDPVRLRAENFGPQLFSPKLRPWVPMA